MHYHGNHKWPTLWYLNEPLTLIMSIYLFFILTVHDLYAFDSYLQVIMMLDNHSLAWSPIAGSSGGSRTDEPGLVTDE